LHIGQRAIIFSPLTAIVAPLWRLFYVPRNRFLDAASPSLNFETASRSSGILLPRFLFRLALAEICARLAPSANVAFFVRRKQTKNRLSNLARQSRNSEYLPQRAKGREVNRFVISNRGRLGPSHPRGMTTLLSLGALARETFEAVSPAGKPFLIAISEMRELEDLKRA